MDGIVHIEVRDHEKEWAFVILLEKVHGLFGQRVCDKLSLRNIEKAAILFITPIRVGMAAESLLGGGEALRLRAVGGAPAEILPVVLVQVPLPEKGSLVTRVAEDLCDGDFLKRQVERVRRGTEGGFDGLVSGFGLYDEFESKAGGSFASDNGGAGG